jgi:hypothetical protein
VDACREDGAVAIRVLDGGRTSRCRRVGELMLEGTE